MQVNIYFTICMRNESIGSVGKMSKSEREVITCISIENLVINTKLTAKPKNFFKS